MQITVLGAGMVGGAMVKDLAAEPGYRITVVDSNPNTLDQLEAQVPVKGILADLQKIDSVKALVADSDLVICAVPGFMGFETIRKIIEAGKDLVDISFFSEDPFLLDEPAKSKGVTAVVDCGVAPGLCNILCGHVDNLLDQTNHYSCYVGGLPVVRRRPYEYQAVFSPVDVIEEYTRPARLIENGRQIVVPALSDVERIDFETVGTLEAFYTDGLRTLMRTMKIPSMKEKTMRYPGHAELMRIFRDSGFFEKTEMNVKGQSVRPIDVTSALLFHQWKFEAQQEDLTVMRVIMEGTRKGKPYRHIYDLLDRYDKNSQTSSMARTTGYTCTGVVRELAAGRFTRKGICPPEFVGQCNDCYENILRHLEQRDIHIKETVLNLLTV